MKMVLWMALALTSASLAFAGSIVAVDAYAGQNNDGSNNGDVVGQLRSFDIDFVGISNTGNNVSVVVRMNYGPDGADAGLSPISFSSFPDVNPGDLMLTNGSNHWAIPLISHNNSNPGGGGLTMADLYLVTGFLTSSTVLNIPPSTHYRPDEYVWGDSNGAQKLNNGLGSRSVTAIGGYELEILINFTLDTNANTLAFLNALNDSNTLLHFAAATCGNDIVDGTPPGRDESTPEPATFALLGGGLLSLALWKCKSSM